MFETGEPNILVGSESFGLGLKAALTASASFLAQLLSETLQSWIYRLHQLPFLGQNSQSMKYWSGGFPGLRISEIL